MSQPQRRRSTTSGSFRIAEVAGIPIRIHVSFALILVYVVVVSPRELLFLATGLMMAVFGCVLLHELGHALVARQFGVNTRDITLYPIGGVAMLEGRPKPSEELWIALAGPVVNLFICGLLTPIIFLVDGAVPGLGLLTGDRSVLQLLFTANLTLFLFNLIPAFPMDGGRVLRSLLAMTMREAQATRIAAGVGQLIAILMGFAGIIFEQPMLLLVAFFVFIGASQEVSVTVARSFLEGHVLADAMQTDFRTISSGDSLDQAGKLLLQGSQQDFPVMNGDEVLGVLTRQHIANGMANDGPDGYVAGHMSRELLTAPPTLPLEQAMELLGQGRGLPILVMEAEELLGLVTTENLGEFVMLQHARSRGNRA